MANELIIDSIKKGAGISENDAEVTKTHEKQSSKAEEALKLRDIANFDGKQAEKIVV